MHIMDIREIVFDTETTGFNPDEGDRLVEIGCVELINHIPTGKTYHVYVNPEREVPVEAFAVHGLDAEFLKDKPKFGEIVVDFLEFIGHDSKLIAHNAEFDMKFVNWELRNFGFPSLDKRRVIDTLMIARQKFPGSPASLDALCRRFGIDNTCRTLHGALLDAELLSDVYIELLGGRQRGLELSDEDKKDVSSGSSLAIAKREFRDSREFLVSDEESSLHDAMLEELKNPLWRKL